MRSFREILQPRPERKEALAAVEEILAATLVL
jgi:hypothetical protein